MHTPPDDLTCIDKSLAASLLSAISKIFDCWKLDDGQRLILLGLDSEQSVYWLNENPERAILTRDLLDRTSYILGIYRSLKILFPDASLADRWIAKKNDNPLFSGRMPLERMLSGQPEDLALVRDFLDAQ